MAMIKSILQNKTLILVVRIFLGALFVYASIDKIHHPLAFAQVIHHYRLTPPFFINYLAVIMPWIEIVCGILLIAGFRVKAASLAVSLMLAFFLVVLSITAARGINVSCGCFTTSMAVKSNLVLRIIEDAGMFLLGLYILVFYRRYKSSAAA